MPDSGINPCGQFPIPDDGGVLHAPLGFQVNYIIAVACKGLAGIGGGSLFALLFNGCGESLSLFSCAFFCPCMGTSNVAVNGLSCLPSAPRPRKTRMEYEISLPDLSRRS